ncbi:MAG: ATP-binding protein [Candidatus Pacebacteria bacterium]|nr:ATP-binding protein [Candidatus Paceibacterota bacterium]
MVNTEPITTRTIDIDEHLKRESIFRIGTVHSVSGRKIKVEVFKNKNHPYLVYNGQITKNVATGSYIKIKKGLTTIIGKIEGEEIDEDTYFNDKYGKEEVKIRRFLNVSLFGHYENGRFYQGIKELPLIDNECYVLEESDFIKLHNFFEEDDLTIDLGKLSEDPSHTIKASVNKLFASHIGIFGNTGSGKSNTLARIYTELFKTISSLASIKNNSRFVFIDFNGEYTSQQVLSENKKCFILNTRKRAENITEEEKYAIDANVLKDAEILSVLLHATEKTQKPFLASVLENDFLADPNNYTQSVKITLKNIIERAQPTAGVDKILGFLNEIKEYTDDTSTQSLNVLIGNIEFNLAQNAKGSFMWNHNYNHDIWNEMKLTLNSVSFRDDLNPIDEIQLKICLSYYHRISTSTINADHVGPLISRMNNQFRFLKKVICVKDEMPEENIIVVSLRNVKLEMKKILPLIICKHIYEIQKRKNDEKEKIESSLHIIIDEAHNILSEESERESELWKDYRLETFEEIIKEGRKFGTFLTIASQRPYDISQTIISQLHNYFIHRLINNNDLNAVRKAVAYLDDLSFDTISILSVGSCFFAGLATDIPIKINIELLEEGKQPRSETITLTDAWSQNSNQNGQNAERS